MHVVAPACDCASNKNCVKGSSMWLWAGRKGGRSALTARAGFAVMSFMGTLRSPHEATCPSIASRFFQRGRIHVIIYIDIFRQTCTTDRHGEDACPDRRA